MIELYGKQASAAGGVLVIRGLVGNPCAKQLQHCNP
ncbi:hypothetical protein H2136_20520 [Aeromonas hydrophila]|uniref:Uncharacterized protein n=1 Tax=Aeromonas hydrophila TaxID=644 RepID=A0A926FPQ7_AERHY|nr:hypothetical protein [Aeromonas hydrophila]